MGKLNQLNGVANNLADSFISVTNIEFLKHIETLPVEKTKQFEINLLEQTIQPGDLQSEKTASVINRYKDWFDKETKKLGISLEDIQSVMIIVTLKRGNISRNYTCKVTITAQQKDYVGQKMSMFT